MQVNRHYKFRSSCVNSSTLHILKTWWSKYKVLRNLNDPQTHARKFLTTNVSHVMIKSWSVTVVWLNATKAILLYTQQIRNSPDVNADKTAISVNCSRKMFKENKEDSRSITSSLMSQDNPSDHPAMILTWEMGRESMNLCTCMMTKISEIRTGSEEHESENHGSFNLCSTERGYSDWSHLLNEARTHSRLNFTVNRRKLLRVATTR